MDETLQISSLSWFSDDHLLLIACRYTDASRGWGPQDHCQPNIWHWRPNVVWTIPKHQDGEHRQAKSPEIAQSMVWKLRSTVRNLVCFWWSMLKPVSDFRKLRNNAAELREPSSGFFLAKINRLSSVPVYTKSICTKIAQEIRFCTLGSRFVSLKEFRHVMLQDQLRGRHASIQQRLSG